MKKFIIENEFWSLFPKAQIGIVLCHGIDNHIGEPEKYENMLREAEKEAYKYFLEAEFSSNEVVAVWRAAFQQFKTKKGARSSIEALLKRVHNGNQIGNINPLVDIYNCISLKYGLPCGGEDIDTFDGDIKLTIAEGNEAFVPLGSEESAPPYAGEVVYKDNAGAICRCWNWREAQRTMLTEHTSNAFLCIELVDANRIEDFNSALKELAAVVPACLGGISSLYVLDKDNSEIEIG